MGEPGGAAKRRSLQAERVGLLAGIVIAGTLAAIVRCLVAYAEGLKYPFTTFLYMPRDRFSDLLLTFRDIDRYRSGAGTGAI